MEYFDPHRERIHSKLNIIITRNVLRLQYYWHRYVLRKKIIPLYTCISMSNGFIENRNFGDDINIFFLRQISEDFIMPLRFMAYPYLSRLKELNKFQKYCAIGSVLGWVDDSYIVWGAGLIDGNTPDSFPKVNAVRGPLSRNLLLKRGIDCPPIYGDPALLLPLYYRPIVKRKYKIGIVPHYTDYYKRELDKFRSVKDVLIVKIFDYKRWEDVINEICSCELIFSSSLHGLIIAEAYGIPNVWCEVNEPLVGNIHNRFKFYDFYESVCKTDMSPFTINNETNLTDMLKQKLHYREGVYRLQPLLDACPWTLKSPIYSSKNL